MSACVSSLEYTEDLEPEVDEAEVYERVIASLALEVSVRLAKRARAAFESAEEEALLARDRYVAARAELLGAVRLVEDASREVARLRGTTD